MSKDFKNDLIAEKDEKNGLMKNSLKKPNKVPPDSSSFSLKLRWVKIQAKKKGKINTGISISTNDSDTRAIKVKAAINKAHIKDNTQELSGCFL